MKKMIDGNTEYRLKYERKIQNVLDEYPQLKGFYAFIANAMSISSVSEYLYKVAGFLDYTHKTPRNFTLDDFSAYMLHIQKTHDGSETKTSYRIQVYSALKKYCNYLYASDIISKDFMQYIKRPKPVEMQDTVEKRECGFLSENEIRKYIRDVQVGVGSHESRLKQMKWKERDLAIIKIFLSTGMRCSALIKLDVDSIDFDNKSLMVIDKGEQLKHYDLSDDVLAAIKEWLVKRNELMQTAEANTQALFISHNKTRLSHTSVYRLVNKYAQNIDGKHITPHKLRATYGTQLYRKTGDLYFVQQCMGHSNPTTTELYIRGNKGQTKKASDIMSSIMGKKSM